MKRKSTIGTGLGKGHGSNTNNFPIIREVDKDNVQIANRLLPTSRLFKMGKVKVIVDQHPAHGYTMSVSCRDRYPTWDEVAHLRYALIPDEAKMAMMLPSREDYINLHNFCFILNEIKEEAI